MSLIWTNGCFDILHRGHIELFRYAKSLGNKLIVGLDTDEKIRTTKGEDRPFNTLEDRKFVLSSIKYIDEVCVFGSKKELELLIKSLKPDILVIGSDWRGKDVVGEQHAGKVEFFDRVGEFSTTKILER